MYSNNNNNNKYQVRSNVRSQEEIYPEHQHEPCLLHCMDVWHQAQLLGTTQHLHTKACWCETFKAYTTHQNNAMRVAGPYVGVLELDVLHGIQMGVDLFP